MVNSLIKKYNSLNGRKVLRSYLEKFSIELFNILPLESSEIELIWNKIGAVLKAHPNTKEFNIEIKEKISVPDKLTEKDLLGLGIPFISNVEETQGLSKPVSPNDIYNMITERVIELLEKDKGIRWRKPWAVTGEYGVSATNYKTKTVYRGINNFMLNVIAVMVNKKAFDSPYFLSFKQVQDLGGKVKKKAKGHEVIYFSRSYKITQEKPKLNYSSSNLIKYNAFIKKNANKINETAVKVVFPILKYYKVFSADYIEGIDFKKIVEPEKSNLSKIETAELIINHMPNAPELIREDKGDSAHYVPLLDKVVMPKLNYFNNEQEFYSTFFHELIHSTGSIKRLKRNMSGGFRSDSYAFEELIAEFGAIFLCSESGILYNTIDNSTAYIKGWKKQLIPILKKDNRFFFRSVSAAQKGADYILDRDSKGIPKYLSKIIIPKKAKKQNALLGIQSNNKKALSKKVANKNRKSVNSEKLERIVIDVSPEKVFLDANLKVVKNKKKVDFIQPVIKTIEKRQSIVIPEIKKPILKTKTPFKSSFQRRNEKSAPVELYNLVNKDLAKFLGNIEIKPKGSLVITLDSCAGGGKTHTTYQVANAFAESGYKPIIWSLEEHCDSLLSKQKQENYFDQETQHIISVESDQSELSDLENFDRIIQSIEYFDVILIDSWTKLLELNKRLTIDQSFRKKYDGKLFFFIFQRTADGKMRGGAKNEFDGDIILKVNVNKDFKQNFVYNEKNRYNQLSLIDLKYSPYYQCLKTKEEILIE